MTDGPCVGGYQQALIGRAGQGSPSLGVGAPSGNPRALGTAAPWDPFTYYGPKVNADRAIDGPGRFRGSPPPS